MSDWPERIMFFDGDCGLCNLTVRAIAARDRRKVVAFAPLAGSWGTRAEEAALIDRSVDSIFYVRNGEEGLCKMPAVRAIAADVGGWLQLVRVTAILPRWLQDWMYDFVAKRRYGWFGKVEGVEDSVVCERLLD